MPFRQIEVPSLGSALSNIEAAPSSGEPDTHLPGLDAYRELGGNCLHLHGEGGETHSRRTAGEWLREHGLREDFFVCTQICHEGWDEAAKRPIDRFTADAVSEDIAGDLELLGSDYVDLVYLDDRPSRPFAPVLDALAHALAAGRIRAIGVRNWRPQRIREANAYMAAIAREREEGRGKRGEDAVAAPTIAAVVTTELALPVATAPLWPEYLPFDHGMREVVTELGLAVFAHAGDLTSGQLVFGDADALAIMRPEWVRRWDHPANARIAARVREIAARWGVSTREVNLAWLLNQPFPVVAIIGLPALLGEYGGAYARASELTLDPFELEMLSRARSTTKGVSQ
jgi:aryl-alcohol dehydrogenase-like predicted oxidoreductase